MDLGIEISMSGNPRMACRVVQSSLCQTLWNICVIIKTQSVYFLVYIYTNMIHDALASYYMLEV